MNWAAQLIDPEGQAMAAHLNERLQALPRRKHSILDDAPHPLCNVPRTKVKPRLRKVRGIWRCGTKDTGYHFAESANNAYIGWYLSTRGGWFSAGDDMVIG